MYSDRYSMYKYVIVCVCLADQYLYCLYGSPAAANMVRWLPHVGADT